MPTTSPVRVVAPALVLAAVLVLAFNLRLVTMVGPVLGDLQADLGMTDTVAGMLTALPGVCFALFGATAPALANRIGPHRTAAAGLVALLTGAALRTLMPGPWTFMAFTALALAGMALGNVVLPSLVKTHFPNRVSLVTAAYSFTLSIGVTVASMALVPLTLALGSWRHALLAAALSALLAAPLWVPLLKLDAGHHAATREPPLPMSTLARTRLGWLFAIFFGAQSAQAYSLFGWLPSIMHDAGLSVADAGFVLGLLTLVGIPLSFLLPAYTARNPRPRALLTTLGVSALAGYLGLLIAPAALPWLWAVLISIGTASFPVILAMFGLRSRTISGTVALSGFTQTIGYLIAIGGPFAMGAIHEATGSWQGPILLLIGLVVPLVGAGWLVCGSGFIEDELPVLTPAS